MIKLLDKKIGGKSHDIGTDKCFKNKHNFIGNRPKHWRMGLHKNKVFCKARESIDRMNRQCLEWEKNLSAIFQTWLTNKICK